MRFGLFGGAKAAGSGPDADSQGYRAFIDYVIRAEALGFESLFMVEHHFTGVGQVSASLNLLTYLAARTRRIRLGTAVVVLPWHNPALLAEQAATLDLLSDGRFDFGIGKGYRKSEFAGFAIPQDEAEARFAECVDVLRRAWTEPGRFSHRGRFWRFDDVVVEPRPIQQPHPPFWMAAGSPASIRRAAREGFNLLLDQLAPIDLTLERAALYRDALEAAGRGRHSCQIAVARALQLVETADEREQALAVRQRVLTHIGDLARGRGAERYQSADAIQSAGLAGDDSALIGTPEEITARLQRLAAGEIDQVLLIDPNGRQRSLEVFAAEIAPAFRATP
ncbi:MAG: LLM class flavin-dependent oxidoreductase [Alphaproteobacteria bacterium]|nr:LLM class flavin-dependent oxidoreductase [Alphaproteobacteria bacterium]MCB9930980.1 LLM class flavin-dependent oxidoreductase [Alphaproteobacteria bacterium]